MTELNLDEVSEGMAVALQLVAAVREDNEDLIKPMIETIREMPHLASKLELYIDGIELLCDFVTNVVQAGATVMLEAPDLLAELEKRVPTQE